MLAKSTVMNRRELLYTSLVIAIAMLLSAGLLQMTKATAISAQQENGTPAVEFRIYKTVNGEKATTDWEFQIVTESGPPSVRYIDGAGGWYSQTYPIGTITITELSKDGYYLESIECGKSCIDCPSPEPQYGYAVVALEEVTGTDFYFCSFENTQYSTVTVVKDAIPDDPQPFDFVMAYDPDIQFTLVDDGSGLSNTWSITGLMAGNLVSIYEGHAEGWIPQSVQCLDSEGQPLPVNGIGDIQAAMPPVVTPYASFSILAGYSYTCTFTNVAPRLELTKTVGTDAGVCAATSEIDVQAGTEVHYCYEATNTGGVTLTHHSLVDSPLGELFADLEYDLAPGDSVNTIQLSKPQSATPIVDTTNTATWTSYMTHTFFNKIVPFAAGAEPAFANDLPIPPVFPDGVLTLSVEASDSAIVNVLQPGRIIVDKVVSPTTSTQSFDFALNGDELEDTFSLTGGATPYASDLLPPGTYSVTETVVESWELVETSCTDGSEVSDIQIESGETVTCTFVNEQQPPTALDDSDFPTLDRFLFLPDINQ